MKPTVLLLTGIFSAAFSLRAESVCDVRSLGAAGDGRTKDTAAIQRAIDQVSAAGGGEVFVPAGTYLCGTLYLKDGVDLHIGVGATIKGSTNREDYCAADFTPQNWASGPDVDNTSGGHLVVAVGCRNVTLRGPGKIDGSGPAFLLDAAGCQWPNWKRGIPWRPGQMVWMCDSENIRITDLELADSPYWTCYLLNCERVWIRGCHVHNERRRFKTWNGDGFDLDRCCHVAVSDCLIDTTDDCITLRASSRSRLVAKPPKDCAFVTVANCVLSSSCNAIRIGVGEGRIHDATFSNLVISDTDHAFNFVGAYSKGNRGTDITDIRIANVTVDAEQFLWMSHRHSQEALFDNIVFSGISGHVNRPSRIEANAKTPFRRIRFLDVDLPLGVKIENADVTFRGGTLAAFPAHGADLDFLGTGAACGWKPADPDAFYFLHASDLHMTESPDWGGGALQMKDKFMGRCFLDDVNAMNGLAMKPSWLFLTGDLTSHATMDPKTWPLSERKWAHFRKYVTSRLQVPFRQMLGNNDCPSVPYTKVFPDEPLYWREETKGVLFCGLHGYNCWKVENSNHAGICYDEAQLKWLADVVRTSRARTLVLLTHEPLVNPDSALARRQLAPIVDSFGGEFVWNFCGHDHVNADTLFRIGRRMVRGAETMTPVGCGFKVGDGGFRVAYCKSGEIVGTALRWLTKAGEPIGFAPCPPATKPSLLVEDALPLDALKTVLIGTEPSVRPTGRGFEDRISNWILWGGRPGGAHFVRWAVPGSVGGRRVRAVALYLWEGFNGQFGFSQNGTDFVRVPASADGKGVSGVVRVEVPEGFASEILTVELYTEAPGHTRLCGYSLLEK